MKSDFCDKIFFSSFRHPKFTQPVNYKSQFIFTPFTYPSPAKAKDTRDFQKRSHSRFPAARASRYASHPMFLVANAFALRVFNASYTFLIERKRESKQGQVGQRCVLFEWTFFMNERFLWMNECYEWIAPVSKGNQRNFFFKKNFVLHCTRVHAFLKIDFCHLFFMTSNAPYNFPLFSLV